MLEQARRFYQTTPPGKAIAIGVAAAVLAPTLFSLLKPVAKATLKTGLILLEKGKGTVAEAGEVLGDILAEAKAEVALEQEQKASWAAQLNPEQPPE